MIGHSSNLLGVPMELLVHRNFNDHPMPLHISGVREMNPNLFEMLDLSSDLSEAGEAFACYMMAMFGIDREQREDTPGQEPAEAPALSRVIPAVDQGVGIRQQRTRRGRAQGLGRKPVRHISHLSQGDH